MADFMVIAVTLVMSLQVLIFGGFIFWAANEKESEQTRPSAYNPMEILMARAAAQAAQGKSDVPPVDQREAA